MDASPKGFRKYYGESKCHVQAMKKQMSQKSNKERSRIEKSGIFPHPVIELITLEAAKWH